MCLIVGLLFAFAIDEVLLLAPEPALEPLWFAEEDEDEPPPPPDCRLVELDELLDEDLLLLRLAEV